VDDRVGDQPRALVPDLLLGLRPDAELPGVDVGDRASKPVIGFTAIERFLNALPKSDLVDVGEDVERSVEIVQFPQRFLGLILSTGYEHPIGD
jgi:hypothetical protein